MSEIKEGDRVQLKIGRNLCEGVVEEVVSPKAKSALVRVAGGGMVTKKLENLSVVDPAKESGR